MGNTWFLGPSWVLTMALRNSMLSTDRALVRRKTTCTRHRVSGTYIFIKLFKKYVRQLCVRPIECSKLRFLQAAANVDRACSILHPVMFWSFQPGVVLFVARKKKKKSKTPSVRRVLHPRLPADGDVLFVRRQREEERNQRHHQVVVVDGRPNLVHAIREGEHTGIFFQA